MMPNVHVGIHGGACAPGLGPRPDATDQRKLAMGVHVDTHGNTSIAPVVFLMPLAYLPARPPAP